MKMKQLKPLIITAIVCIILGLGTWAAITFIPELTEEETPVATPSGSSIYIVNKSANMVESINITPDEGRDFNMIYSIDKTGKQVAKLTGEGEEFNYDGEAMYTLAGFVSILVAIDEIAEPEGRDKEFGFNNPRRKLKINFSDGEKIELVLGADAPSGEGVYIKRSDTKKVYLIGGSTTDMLMKSQLDYRDITMYEKYESVEMIKKVTIERKGMDTITVARKENAEPITEENPTAPQYEITSPDNMDGDNNAVESKLFTPLIAIKAASHVEDYPKDLGKYGLNNPTIVKFEDKYGDSHTLKIGRATDNGGNYIMCDDVPSVLLTEETVPFLNVKHTDFVMELLWLHNMQDVSEVKYTLSNGAAHTLKFARVGDAITAMYDGKAISNENAVNLYMHTIQFTIQGAVGDVGYAAPECSISMILNDGTLTTMELMPMNERQYAVSIDGKKPMYYVSIAQVKALSDAFEIIASGGTVPSIF